MLRSRGREVNAPSLSDGTVGPDRQPRPKPSASGISQNASAKQPRSTDSACPFSGGGFFGFLTCISHHLTGEALDTTAMTSFRLLAVLNVL